MDDVAIIELCADVGRALHASGAPAHVVEQTLERLRLTYNRPGASVATPTAIWLQIGEQSRIVRLPPGDIDLDRMVSVLRYVDRIVDAPPAPAVARRAVHRVQDHPSPWPRAVERAAFMTTSASAAVLLGGGLADVALAALAGAVALVFLGRLSPASAWMPLRNALLAALLGAIGALGAAAGASPSVVALSGAILGVPGLSLTTAISELGAGHWTAGGSRLVGATLALGQLAAGLAIGWWAVGPLAAALPAQPLPPAVIQLAPLFAPASFAVLLRARPHDIPAIWLTAAIGWSVAAAFEGVLSAFLGGLAVAAVAGGVGRLARVPELALILPGLLLLVPGTVGVHGVEQLLSRDVDAGVTTALAALETAAALAAGVFAGQALTSRRGEPKSVPLAA